jgi:hypothetical protein
LLREKDYRQLKAKAANGQGTRSKPRRLTAQDKGDIAESKRRAHEPSIPLDVVRKRLGL